MILSVKCPFPLSPFTFFLGFLNMTATFLHKTNTFSFFNFYTFINVLYRRKTFKVAVSKKFRKPCFSIVRWKIRCLSTTSKALAVPVWFAIFFPVILNELTFSYQHLSRQRAAAASRLSSQGFKFKQLI